MPIAHKSQLAYADRQEMIVNPIANDGIGFDPEGDFRGHLGLRSMQERALKVRGTLGRVCRAGPGVGYLSAPCRSLDLPAGGRFHRRAHPQRRLRLPLGWYLVHASIHLAWYAGTLSW